MIIRIIILLLMAGGMSFGISAQQISVDDFVCLKNPLLGANVYRTDKQSALLDLYTQESGFEFFIGKQQIEAEEGDGFLTLVLPDKTQHFTIKHPKYGQFTWKAPKELRKKKHYQAYLFTDSPDKEYKIEKQWAVFYIQPEQAVVTIDSTLYRTMDGRVQTYLPLGRHSLKVESPFYEAMEDSILLEEDSRLNKEIYLQPFYSYLTVDSHYPDAEIWLDGQLIGRSQARSKRLQPGSYNLTVQKDSLLLYRGTIELAAAERMDIDLKSLSSPSKISYSDAMTDMPADAPQYFHPTVIQPPVLHSDSLHIQAFDDDTEIWVDRELVARGNWDEELPPGTHAISTQKDGFESPTQYIQIGDGETQRLKMPTPYAKYGWMNISSNVVDAVVWVDGNIVGKTPCILTPLSVYKSYTIRLTKEGYKDAETSVVLKKNDMQNIYLELKKK